MELKKLLGINTPVPATLPDSGVTFAPQTNFSEYSTGSSTSSTVKITVNWIDGISDNNFGQITTTVAAYSGVKELFPVKYERVFNDFREGTIGNTEARIDPGFSAQIEVPIDQLPRCLQRIKAERVLPGALVGVDIPETPIDGVGEVLGRTLVESYLLDSGLPEFKPLELPTNTNSGDSSITPPNLTSQLRAATSPAELRIYIFNKHIRLPKG